MGCVFGQSAMSDWSSSSPGSGHVQSFVAELLLPVSLPSHPSVLWDPGVCIGLCLWTVSRGHCCHLHQHFEVRGSLDLEPSGKEASVPRPQPVLLPRSWSLEGWLRTIFHQERVLQLKFSLAQAFRNCKPSLKAWHQLLFRPQELSCKTSLVLHFKISVFCWNDLIPGSVLEQVLNLCVYL